MNRECRSAVSAALDRNLSAVRLRTPTHESETEAPADLALRLGCLCSCERIKYVGLIFQPYHRSIVVHGHLRLRDGALHRDSDRLVRSTVFDSIDDQVPKCASKFLGVPDTTTSIFLLQNETLAIYRAEFSDHHARDDRQITLGEMQGQPLVGMD